MLNFHGYACSGCGHTTIVNKYYKIKLMHCAVCGHKDRMSYLGGFQVQQLNKILKQTKENCKNGSY